MSDFKSVFELDAAQLLHLDGGMLVAIRDELGFNPEEMAERLKCHSSTLNRYENGRITIPTAIIVRVKEMLEEEKKARNLQVSLPAEPGGGQQPWEPAQTWPIVLGRGPLSPGTKLVELLPVETSADVTRTFAAVEEPKPAQEGEPTPGALAPMARARPSARRRRGTGEGAARFAVAALVGGVAASALLVGCLVRISSRPAGAHESEPLRGQAFADKAKAKAAEKSESNDSIPMPKQPYTWQKTKPCNLKRGEIEKVGGCWGKMATPPPCMLMAVESDGACFVPIAAPPKDPVSSNP